MIVGNDDAEVPLQMKVETDARTPCWTASTPLSHPCPIALAVAENTLFALPPINRIVPTSKTKMTATSPHTQQYLGPLHASRVYEQNQ